MDSDGQDVSVSQENVTETIGQAANRMYEEQLRQDETQNSQVVDSEFDDPDPLPVNANRDATRKFNKEVEDYSREMVEAFEVCKYFKGEILWEEYLRTFRRHTIEAMPNALVARWSHLLRMGGIQLRIETWSFTPKSSNRCPGGRGVSDKARWMMVIMMMAMLSWKTFRQLMRTRL